MEAYLKKLLYISIAAALVALCNSLVLKPLFENDKTKDIMEFKTIEPKIIEKEDLMQKNLYSKSTISKDNVNDKSQEWYQVNLRSDAIIKFQYSNKKNDISKFNLKVNDTVIENDEEFFDYDKFKLNFHLYGNTLVIEHSRSYDHIPYVKIIDLESGTMRNLPMMEDFYINNTIIDEYGVTIELSRLTSKLSYYLDKNETTLTFRVANNNVSMNVCDKATWSDELINLDYVAFDINYAFQDDAINFDKPDITNFKKLDSFLKNHLNDFNNICK